MNSNPQLVCVMPVSPPPQVKDCHVLASKLLFILDDLLWVLTDSQLKAIIHYAKSLTEAMEKSAQQRKSMAADSLQVTGSFSHSHYLSPLPCAGGVRLIEDASC